MVRRGRPFGQSLRARYGRIVTGEDAEAIGNAGEGRARTDRPAAADYFRPTRARKVRDSVASGLAAVTLAPCATHALRATTEMSG